MCLAIPGRLLEFIDEAPLTRSGRVAFGGVVKEVSLAFVPEAAVGAYLLTHVGVAIAVIDEAEAERTLAHLAEIGELEAEDGA